MKGKRIAAFVTMCIIYVCLAVVGCFLIFKPDILAMRILDWNFCKSIEIGEVYSKLLGLLYLSLFPTFLLYLAIHSPFDFDSWVRILLVSLSLLATAVLGIFYVRACLGKQELLKTGIEISLEDGVFFIVFFGAGILAFLVLYILALIGENSGSSNSFMRFTRKHTQIFLILGSLISTFLAPVIVFVLAFGLVALVGNWIAKIIDFFNGKIPNTEIKRTDDDEEYDATVLDGGSYVGLNKNSFQPGRYDNEYAEYTDEHGKTWVSTDDGKSFREK